MNGLKLVRFGMQVTIFGSFARRAPGSEPVFGVVIGLIGIAASPYGIHQSDDNHTSKE